jgi:segregation and condensation protein A
MSIFNITIENFQGPIDVLLNMIEKRKLPINDISLVDIADDYIRFITTIGDIALSERTQFIFIASTLTLIKSKSLLPSLVLNDDEEVHIEELKRRINTLKAYQDAADVLKGYLRKKPAWYFPRSRKYEIRFQPHPKLTKKHLLDSLYGVFHQLPEPIVTKKEGSVTIAVHIEEMMNSLEKRIRQAIETDFNTFLGDYIKEGMESKQARVFKVVGFLALLEMVRNGALRVIQKKNFSNINLEKI